MPDPGKTERNGRDSMMLHSNLPLPQEWTLVTKGIHRINL